MNKNFFGTAKTHVRLSALIEGISYLVLVFIAMPLKYLADMPLAVKVVGLAHGILFIWYIISVILVKVRYNLSLGKTAWALFLSLVPFGTFYADKKMFKDL